MAKLVLIFSLLSYWPALFAQSTISSKKITVTQIPETIKFRGRLAEAWQWKDNSGDNILITSKVPAYKAKSFIGDENEEAYSAELHAFHFVKKDTTYKLLWKISDGTKGCPFDLTTEFIKDAIKNSDLDKNGIAETTIQYKLACRSDVSPAQMKLIMHEDTIKYALRGSMWLVVSEGMKFNVNEKNVNLETWKDYKGTDEEWEKLYGRYQSEKEFLLAPPSFLNFARRQWLRFVKESFD